MRWKHGPEDTPEADAGVPDAVAVFDDDGELIGWDESAVHAYYAERGISGRCDEECVARGHIDSW